MIWLIDWVSEWLTDWLTNWFIQFVLKSIDGWIGFMRPSQGTAWGASAFDILKVKATKTLRPRRLQPGPTSSSLGWLGECRREEIHWRLASKSWSRFLQCNFNVVTTIEYCFLFSRLADVELVFKCLMGVKIRLQSPLDVRDCEAFDFTTKGILQEACRLTQFWRHWVGKEGACWWKSRLVGREGERFAWGGVVKSTEILGVKKWGKVIVGRARKYKRIGRVGRCQGLAHLYTLHVLEPLQAE